MKRSVYLLGILFLAGVFLIANVFAVCTNDNQTLFRLYQNTNSHVSSWNTTSYSVPICYNDIFGVNYTGLNPHNCTGANTLFWMIAENNSHVSLANDSVYNIPVCYGSLQCRNVTGAVCSGSETLVARLYQSYNSHVSNSSDTNYNVGICCTSSPLTTVSLSWYNLNDGIISVSQYRDYVALFFGSGNIGMNINYSIRNSTHEIYSGSSNKGFVYWKANVAAGNYTYRISNDNWNTWNSSNNLTVIASENDKAPSQAVILSPVEGSSYSINSPILFNQISMDEDDLMTLSWDYGDGTSPYVLSNYSYFEKSKINSSLGDVQKNYSSSGVYNIKLSVIENERSANLYAFNYTSVYIFQPGINVIPIINSPAKGVTLPTDIVTFNASGTYVANCSTGIIANKNFSTSDGKLNCSYLHAPFSNRASNLSGYSLVFNWTFDDGRNIINSWTDRNYYNVVEFIYRFQEARQHYAKLTVSYN